MKTKESTHNIDTNSQRNLLEANHSSADKMRASLVNPLSQSGPVTSVLTVGVTIKLFQCLSSREAAATLLFLSLTAALMKKMLASTLECVFPFSTNVKGSDIKAAPSLSPLRSHTFQLQII